MQPLWLLATATMTSLVLPRQQSSAQEHSCNRAHHGSSVPTLRVTRVLAQHATASAVLVVIALDSRRILLD